MDRNEAIDVIRKNWPDGRHQLSEALETLIPELKENEDERIRKGIIKTINDLNTEWLELHRVTKEEVLAWLESLKPNHWKPSEYDISLLEEIARNIRNNVRPFCSEVSSLEDLIKNLKTL
jgi:hypothetical protein